MSEFPVQVTIDEARYEDLVDTEKLYLALRDAGVDNWKGYGFAMDIYRGEAE